MRIDPKVVVSPIQLDSAKPRTTGAAVPAKGGDVVQLSAAASAASERTEQPTNTQRLDKIRALLNAGEYAVDLDQLASRIVDDDVARMRKMS